MDDNIADHLRHQLQQLKQYEASVLEYLEEWERMRDGLEVASSSERDKSLDKKMHAMIAENPLNALQVIRRLTINMPQLLRQLDVITTGFKMRIDTVQKEPNTPSLTYKEDLKGALTGLLRLQGVYLLSSKDLAQGKIQNLQTSTKLTITDCTLMAQESKHFDRLDLFVEWTEQAHEICMSSEEQSHCAHTTWPMLRAAILEHDETKRSDLEAQQQNDTYKTTQITFPNYTAEVPASQQSRRAETDPLLKNPQSPMTLCYMERRLLEPEQEAKLFCNYLTRSDDPYVTLQRFKVEVQSLEPMIMTIHDVVSSSEVDLIQKIAIPNLQRSGVSNEDDPTKSQYNEHRISETAWIGDKYDLAIETISQRIQRITGLSTQGPDAEMLQVVNYGIGGQFNPHFDFLLSRKQVDQQLNDTRFMGNRILTFLIYLSDVRLGGSTTFPFAQVAVRPQKGSATMWYNLKENGNPDFRTLHSGCPVLYGSKWIANKWILERGQLFRHPCPKA